MMNKFSIWLSTNRGMATRLRKRLGINNTNISNAKSGTRPIPQHWFEHIKALSKGKIGLNDLLQINLARKALRESRK